MDHLLTWIKSRSKMRQMRWIVGDADELRSGDFSRGLGATTETKCSHKNWKNEKKKPF